MLLPQRNFFVKDVSSAVSASVPDVENKKDYDGGEDEDTDGRRSEGGVMRSGSGGISGGGVNNKRNSAETGAGAVGAVLLDGNYDKELSSIRGQVRETFLAVGVNQTMYDYCRVNHRS